MDFGAYFSAALTDPECGFYTTADPFNREGHFITSPEISPIFGELMAVFVQLFWGQNGMDSAEHPKVIAELGPGTGALAREVLRSIWSFGCAENLEYIFVEVSPKLATVQQQTINEFFISRGLMLEFADSEGVETLRCREKKLCFRWVRDLGGLASVVGARDGPCRPFVLAHEFFDALPAQKFRFSSGRWRELLIGPNPTARIGGTKVFDVVPGPSDSPSVKNILRPEIRFASPPPEGTEIEVSPVSLFHMDLINSLCDAHKGASLIIDYGEKHAFTDSLIV